MDALIAFLPGDGIGPEVSAEAQRVLTVVARRFGHNFRFEDGLIGGAALAQTGEALPEATLALARRAHAVFLGAIGDARYQQPETSLLDLRRELGVFANLRPIVTRQRLASASPIKPALLKDVDIMFVRELIGGIYFGEKHRDAESASDLCCYTVGEIERIVRCAARLAMRRGRQLTSIDKANVLETSRLWRAVTTRVVANEFPAVELEHLLVDAFAMHLLTRPREFDVVVTENMFGDILTDEASVLTGSLGMLPSASLGESKPGIFEPVHGSAPDIAGKGIANPLGAILAAAMLLCDGLDLEQEAMAVERAVCSVIDSGLLTADLGGSAGTVSVGVAVCDCIDASTEPR